MAMLLEHPCMHAACAAHCLHAIWAMTMLHCAVSCTHPTTLQVRLLKAGSTVNRSGRFSLKSRASQSDTEDRPSRQKQPASRFQSSSLRDRNAENAYFASEPASVVATESGNASFALTVAEEESTVASFRSHSQGRNSAPVPVDPQASPAGVGTHGQGDIAATSNSRSGRLPRALSHGEHTNDLDSPFALSPRGLGGVGGGVGNRTLATVAESEDGAGGHTSSHSHSHPLTYPTDHDAPSTHAQWAIPAHRRDRPVAESYEQNQSDMADYCHTDEDMGSSDYDSEGSENEDEGGQMCDHTGSMSAGESEGAENESEVGVSGRGRAWNPAADSVPGRHPWMFAAVWHASREADRHMGVVRGLAGPVSEGLEGSEGGSSRMSKSAMAAAAAAARAQAGDAAAAGGADGVDLSPRPSPSRSITLPTHVPPSWPGTPAAAPVAHVRAPPATPQTPTRAKPAGEGVFTRSQTTRQPGSPGAQLARANTIWASLRGRLPDKMALAPLAEEAKPTKPAPTGFKVCF